MIPELASKYNLWQVGSVIFLMVYHKYKVGRALMYMQHKNMVCGKLHIFHYLFLDQNINVNAYSTPFLYEDLDVDHKVVMMGIGLYQNIFSLLYVQHKHYTEHDTLYLCNLFYWLFLFICPDSWLQVYNYP